MGLKQPTVGLVLFYDQETSEHVVQVASKTLTPFGKDYDMWADVSVARNPKTAWETAAKRFRKMATECEKKAKEH